MPKSLLNDINGKKRWYEKIKHSYLNVAKEYNYLELKKDIQLGIIRLLSGWHSLW